YVPPVSDGSGSDRALLRKSLDLLAEAGYTVRNEVDPEQQPGFFDRVMTAIGLRNPVTRRVLRGPDGAPVILEFLLEEPSFEPHHMAFVRNLASIGVKATVRLVDPVQYRARVDGFDFDLTVQRFSF